MIFNISTRKVGGLRFVKIGRFTLMFCISNRFRPFEQPADRFRDSTVEC